MVSEQNIFDLLAIDDDSRAETTISSTQVNKKLLVETSPTVDMPSTSTDYNGPNYHIWTRRVSMRPITDNNDHRCSPTIRRVYDVICRDGDGGTRSVTMRWIDGRQLHQSSDNLTATTDTTITTTRSGAICSVDSPSSRRQYSDGVFECRALDQLLMDNSCASSSNSCSVTVLPIDDESITINTSQQQQPLLKVVSVSDAQLAVSTVTDIDDDATALTPTERADLAQLLAMCGATDESKLDVHDRNWMRKVFEMMRCTIDRNKKRIKQLDEESNHELHRQVQLVRRLIATMNASVNVSLADYHAAGITRNAKRRFVPYRIVDPKKVDKMRKK